MFLPEPATVYQLRIRLDRISPMVWRRLLVSDTTTIAELHAIIQLAFGWRNDYLHQFLIYGKAYGISSIGGTSFVDDPHSVRLADFRFRKDERFFYEYNFYVPWRHEIRLEQILPASPGRRYPICIGGARAAPPDECAGPSAFLALRHEHDSLPVIQRLLALIDNPEEYPDPDEELGTLRYSAGVNRCNRRAINRDHPKTGASHSEAVLPMSQHDRRVVIFALHSHLSSTLASRSCAARRRTPAPGRCFEPEQTFCPRFGMVPRQSSGARQPTLSCPAPR